MKSVRRFAANILKEVPRIDVLINNGTRVLYVNVDDDNILFLFAAGIMFPPYELTEDGFESQFQVNYLSHFLLTDLLLDRIKETAKRSDKIRACRIVNTASEANNGADLDFEDLEIW
jgi:NAD(P)-dependent dehydrogenase (short-subunit alcohol dehydrogenase family)